MCAGSFCLDFKTLNSCVDGKWGHDFGTDGDRELAGYNGEIAIRECIHDSCRLQIWLDDSDWESCPHVTRDLSLAYEES